eukprot:268520_1
MHQIRMNGLIHYQTIILVSFFILVSSHRSQPKCEFNFDCESCVGAPSCMWTSNDIDDDTDLMEHSLISHPFFKCKPASGLFNIDGIAHAFKGKLIAKTTAFHYCANVNSDYKNICSDNRRNTLETCVANSHLYKGCAWDIVYKICVNKDQDDNHPNP